MLARGDQVVVADDLSTGDRANLNKRAELRIADVSNATAFAEALRGERADAVVHLAAKTKVVESMEREALYRRVVVGGPPDVLHPAETPRARPLLDISAGGGVFRPNPQVA